MKRLQLEWTGMEYGHEQAFLLAAAQQMEGRLFSSVRQFAEAMKEQYECVRRIALVNGNVCFIFFTEQ